MQTDINKFTKIILVLSMLCLVCSGAVAESAKKETKTGQTPASAEKAGARAAPAKTATGPVDLNTADQKTLESLPGIGPATAREIIKGRPYGSVEDLGRVKGMSKGKIQKIRGMVTVSQPQGSQPSTKTAPPAKTAVTPASRKPAKTESAVPKSPATAEKKSAGKLAPGEKVNINTASKEMIEGLPGIGPARAQAIIDGRPYNAPEDIMKVKGIKQKTFDKIRDQITVR